MASNSWSKISNHTPRPIMTTPRHWGDGGGGREGGRERGRGERGRERWREGGRDGGRRREGGRWDEEEEGQ